MNPEELAKFLHSLRLLGGQGLTEKQIREYYEYSDKEWRDLKLRTPGVEKAIASGKAHAISKVAVKLLDRALSGDLRAIIFYLKSKAGWQDEVVDEKDAENEDEKGYDKLTIDFNNPTEAIKIYQKVMLKKED